MDRPENPVKDGYSFVGWYTEDGTKYDFSLPVTQDLRLIARFEKQDVTGNLYIHVVLKCSWNFSDCQEKKERIERYVV